MYAGQQVGNGDKAKAYADAFIGRHLEHVYNGLTYSQVSSLAHAGPTDAKLSAAKTTLFQGESLRSMLLSAWGWSPVALYAFHASIGLMVATAVVAAALIFATRARRARGRSRPRSRRQATRPRARRPPRVRRQHRRNPLLRDGAPGDPLPAAPERLAPALAGTQ